MHKVIKYARLHQGLYFPEAGDLGNVLPPMSKTLENLVMSTDGTMLTVDFVYKGRRHESIIPCANVAIMVVKPEEPKAASLKAVK